MSCAIERATPDQVVGRIVGEPGEHIAVAVMPHQDGVKQGYVLAVRRDGRQYATWEYGWNIAEDGVNTWWGHYFEVASYGRGAGAAGAAFDAAVRDFYARAGHLSGVPIPAPEDDDGIDAPSVCSPEAYQTSGAYPEVRQRCAARKRHVIDGTACTIEADIRNEESE